MTSVGKSILVTTEEALVIKFGGVHDMIAHMQVLYDRHATTAGKAPTLFNSCQ